MILADTGYFLALAQVRDSLHARAASWALAVARDRTTLLVHEYVLVEVMDGLSAPVDRPKAERLAALVRAGRPYQFVPASPHLLDAGLALHAARPDKEWSLTDCVSFHVMRDRGLTRALAYDHHFAQAGFEPLLQRDP